MKPISANVAKHKTLPQDTKQQLEVFNGKKNLFVKHSEIAIIYLSENIVWIQTLDYQKLHTNQSLAKLTDVLSPKHFFRLNRQVITSRKIVKGYSRLDYQKLEVLINDDFSSGLNLIVSKYNSPSFKKWLTNSS
ncbi:LytTR family transcriptional regulator DNA-binding domain-containing protein [Winogradskyella luteola]|uniref:LytTR family transcriptional regulator n=1 Tax=Winogradskyella luteola TaxID=2828330 RepID=A0A9X1F786_9FLAO|nr:LytTR family transcriptional regulator DNA-binding domain-containing protein [Winogradskyella luteola]MBV7268650.1 LytTR family transcriptional regulator [Winogradskyella luteola]